LSEYIHRPLNRHTPGEYGFCHKSWVESFASSPLAAILSLSGRLPREEEQWAPAPDYFHTWKPLVSHLLDTCHVRVSQNLEGLVAGFLVWEMTGSGTVVHYLYVRMGERGRGVAKALISELPGGPVTYTHRSRGLTQTPPGWRYSIGPLIGRQDYRRAA
jgi:hypothetical protein